jgi:peptidoglycan/xylan/chitin deacetylase (PgdA/CDA1 family)
VGIVFGSITLTHADTTNIVTNGDLETATSDGSMPTGWFPDTWGQNTAAFSYLSEGHGGSKAVRATISNYQNGDAKWLFNAATITGGGRYTYADWYRANVETNLWARYEMQNGSVQFQWLKTVPASPDWSQVTTAVAAPDAAARMNVFHVINANGQLDVDDVSLTQQVTCDPAAVNGLVNGGLEDTCPDTPDAPAGWQSQSYGAVPATFSYGADAHQGAHAVGIHNTSDNTEGGWTTTIAAPLANQRYALSFWQSGSTYAYAYLTETMTDGTTKDVSLMSVPATNNQWSQYKDVFITPAAIQSIKLTIATSGSGTVTLDDVSLQPLANQSPQTFSAGMVSVTFDDGVASSYTNGTSVMTTNGFKGTYYLNGDTLGTPGYMSENQVKNLKNAGHEVGSHLYHHSDIAQLDTPTLVSELSGNRTTIQEILGANYAVNSFASPYGSYTSGAIDTVMQYAESHRNTDGELNTKANLDPRQIHGRLVTSSTTVNQLKSWITEAQNTKSWLVLVYHGIATGTDPNDTGEAGYQVTPTVFKNQMTALKQSGVTVKTVHDALATLQTQ